MQHASVCLGRVIVWSLEIQAEKSSPSVSTVRYAQRQSNIQSIFVSHLNLILSNVAQGVGMGLWLRKSLRDTQALGFRGIFQNPSAKSYK